jgi:hypothetical protein
MTKINDPDVRQRLPPSTDADVQKVMDEFDNRADKKHGSFWNRVEIEKALIRMKLCFLDSTFLRWGVLRVFYDL